MKYHSQAVRDRAWRIFGPKTTPTMPDEFRRALDGAYEEVRAIYERGDPVPSFTPYPGPRLTSEVA